MNFPLESARSLQRIIREPGLETQKALRTVARRGYASLNDLPRAKGPAIKELLVEGDPSIRVRSRVLILPDTVQKLEDRDLKVRGVSKILFERKVGGVYFPTQTGISVTYDTPYLNQTDRVLIGASGRTFIAGENGLGTEQYSSLPVKLTLEEAKERGEKPVEIASDYSNGLLVGEFVNDALRSIGINTNVTNLPQLRKEWAALGADCVVTSERSANLYYRRSLHQRW